MTEKEKFSYLVGRLLKECSNSRGYMGVEYDNFEVHEGETECEVLFHKIMDEMVNVGGNPSEYVEDDFDRGEYGEFKPFRTDKNLIQYLDRLRKFVKKYAPKYLEEDVAKHIVKEVDKY